MTTVIRGLGSIRPDRVYATGVISPMTGFQPQAEVQSIARSFTQGPPSMTVLGAGLGGLGENAFTRFGLRVKAWFANMRAAKVAVNAATAAPVSAVPQIPAAPAMSNAHVVAPQIATQMQMLHQLTPQGNATQAADMVAIRRYNTYYRAG